MNPTAYQNGQKKHKVFKIGKNNQGNELSTKLQSKTTFLGPSLNYDGNLRTGMRADALEGTIA